MTTVPAPSRRPGGSLNLPRLLLVTFVVLGYLCTVAPASHLVIGGGGAVLLGFGSLLTFPMVLAAAVWAYETRGLPAPPVSRPLLVGWALALIGMLVFGLLSRNPPRLIAFDLINLSVVILGFILGRRDEVWRDIRWPIAILSLVSAIFCIVLTDSAVLTNRSILNEQAGSTFEPTLAIITLFAMISAADRKPSYHYLALAASVGALLVYLYFARRGNLVRCLIELGIAAIVLPFFSANRKRALIGAALVPVILTAIFVAFPLDTLINRFRGDFGLLDTLTARNERLHEARLMFQEFSFFDTVFGRGLGGSFLLNTVAVEEFVTEEFGNYSGKYMTHGGVYYPILKGGVMFAFLYFLPVALLWFRRARDPITRAVAWAALPWFAFQFIEGAPTHTTPWIGLGIGLILSRCQARVAAAPPRRPARMVPRERVAVA